MTKTQIKDVPNITDTEKRILFLLSKREFKVKEISFIFNRNVATIHSQLRTLRLKGLVIDRDNLDSSRNKNYNLTPKRDIYYTITEKAQRLLSEEKD